MLCQQQLDSFMEICKEINLPVSIAKTVYPTTKITFLGLLIDTIEQMIFLPVEKIAKGRELVEFILSKKKVTVKQLQQLCGFLNFLGRAITPGHAFTRGFYSYTRSKNLQPHYHVRVNAEMRQDLDMWRTFLYHPSIFACPFLDFTSKLTAEVLDMYSDASLNPELGMGATYNNRWIYAQWEEGFVQQCKPKH